MVKIIFLWCLCLWCLFLDCFCQERLGWMILEVPSNLEFYESMIDSMTDFDMDLFIYLSVNMCLSFSFDEGVRRFNIEHEHNKQKLNELFLLLYSLDHWKVKIFPFLLLCLPLDIYNCQWHSVGLMNKEHCNEAWAVVLVLLFSFSLF